MEFVSPESVENKYNLTSTSKQFPNPQHSGRVPNMSDPTLNESSSRPYSLYDTRAAPIFDDPRQELVGHIHKATPLNTIFFSKANIDQLQADIQQQVYLMTDSKHRIDKQNEDDLKLIMRSYYLMFGLNSPDVARDLKDLNSRVIGYASGKIFSELDFYLFYRQDIQDFAPPIANPINVASYGTRYGELKSFF